MLHITQLDERRMAYTVSGQLSMTELAVYYHRLDQQFHRFGKLDLEATVPRFTGFKDLRAFTVFLRHEPTLLYKVATYTARTNNLFVKAAIRTLNVLTRRIQFEVVPLLPHSGTKLRMETA